MVIVAFFDVVGISSVMPFLSLLGDNNLVFENKYLYTLYNYLEFEDVRYFLYFIGLSSLIIIVFSSCLKTLSYYLLYRFTNFRRDTLSKKMFSCFLSKPYFYFSDLNSSEIIKTILYQTDIIVQEALIPLLNLITYSLVSLFILSLFFFVNYQLAFIAIFTFSLFYLSVYLTIRKKLSHVALERDNSNKTRFSIINEAFNGIKDIKIRNKELFFFNKYNPVSYNFADNYAKSMLLPQIPQFSMEAILFGLILIVSTIFAGTNSGNIADILPALGVFTLGALKLKPAVNNIFSSYSIMNFAHPVLSKYVDFFKKESGYNYELTHTNEKLLFEQEIIVDNIYFKYTEDSPTILKKINLCIKKNSIIGLIGETGCGKSTLVNILLGLLSPTKGNIKVDGEILTPKHFPIWKNNIGYVPQDLFLCDDTIAQNIAFGELPVDVDYDIIKKVCEIAKIDSYINSLNNGYDTIVGERGVKLSGGQKQRIGIARALYHDPDFIILDEATSALDGETELAFMDALNSIAGTKTILMIAHRTSTLKHCDEIFQIKDKSLLSVSKSLVL
ncbi:ABC transporter ATP-binding protein/permease [Opitutales bacterium]|nr:ABC transporter ATP-binding protein/permease [Opitutales bacterium]